MKKKVISIIVDLLLITVVFAITDYLMLNVIKSDSLWLEVGVYIVLYGIVFGSKSGIVYLLKKKNKQLNKEMTGEETSGSQR